MQRGVMKKANIVQGVRASVHNIIAAVTNEKAA